MMNPLRRCVSCRFRAADGAINVMVSLNSNSPAGYACWAVSNSARRIIMANIALFGLDIGK
ncbi:hypothetical protein, partial [Crenobacter caeni]